jgi:hypothetical protein
MFALDDFFQPRRPVQYYTRRPDSFLGPFFQPRYYNGRCGPFFRDYEEEDPLLTQRENLQQQRARDEAERHRLMEEYRRQMQHEEDDDEDEMDSLDEDVDLDLSWENQREQLLKRKHEEELQKRKHQAYLEEKRRRMEEERIRQMNERQRLWMEEQARRKAAEEQARLRLLEERKRIEEERKRMEEEKKRKEEELRKKMIEEKQRKEEEARRKVEAAATLIQKHVRGYLVRKTFRLLKKVKQVEAKVEDSRKRWERLLLEKVKLLVESDDAEGTDKEKVKRQFSTTVLAFEEDMVKHLLSLDSIQTGGSSLIREQRRRCALRLQAILADIDKIKRWQVSPKDSSPICAGTLFMQSLLRLLPLAFNDMAL